MKQIRWYRLMLAIVLGATASLQASGRERPEVNRQEIRRVPPLSWIAGNCLLTFGCGLGGPLVATLFGLADTGFQRVPWNGLVSGAMAYGLLNRRAAGRQRGFPSMDIEAAVITEGMDFSNPEADACCVETPAYFGSFGMGCLVGTLAARCMESAMGDIQD